MHRLGEASLLQKRREFRVETIPLSGGNPVLARPKILLGSRCVVGRSCSIVRILAHRMAEGHKNPPGWMSPPCSRLRIGFLKILQLGAVLRLPVDTSVG